MTVEVIDHIGSRHRYIDNNNFMYSFQYGLRSGSQDIDDKSIVEILRVPRDEDAEPEMIAVFSNYARVGLVDDDVCLSPPEKPLYRCPRCGYRQYGEPHE